MASLESIPPCVSECWELLCSEAFFLLLSNFTGLRLHFLCPNDEDDDEEEDEDEDGEKEEKEEEEEEEEEVEEVEEAESQESARGGEATGSAMETPSTKKKTKAKGRGVQGGVGHARPSHPLYVSL